MPRSCSSADATEPPLAHGESTTLGGAGAADAVGAAGEAGGEAGDGVEEAHAGAMTPRRRASAQRELATKREPYSETPR
jgi:hypothetical protein